MTFISFPFDFGRLSNCLKEGGGERGDDDEEDNEGKKKRKMRKKRKRGRKKNRARRSVELSRCCLKVSVTHF